MIEKNTSSKHIKKLEEHRDKLNRIDKELIHLLEKRMKVSANIGKLKYNNHLAIEQSEFWESSSEMRLQKADLHNLSQNFIDELFSYIQKESIRIQQQVFEESNNDN